MPELELTRSSDDRRLFRLDGVGTLRLEGFWRRSATAIAGDGRSWSLSRTGLFSRGIEATDTSGAVVGSFDPRAIRRGGTVTWAGRELTLRPASMWRERYELVDGEDQLFLMHGKGWGRKPVEVAIGEPAAPDAGLVLFTAFVVRSLAEGSSGDGGSAASTSAATS